MKTVIAAAFVAGVLTFGGPALAASPHIQAQTVGIPGATDFSAQRVSRRYFGYGYRPHHRASYPPHYYARPIYYRPYPYAVPAPFTFGFGFGPYW